VDSTPHSAAHVECIRAHFAGELAGATLHLSPFPFLVLPAALPDDVYADVLRHNPFATQPGVAFSAAAPWMSRVRYEHAFDKRFDIPLGPGSTAVAPVWDAIGSAFGSGTWLYDLLVERFPEYFALRFGDATRLPEFWDRLDRRVYLQRHEPGFYIHAHTDVPNRVATLIFSFADQEGFDHCGTQLLAPKDPLERCWGNDHYPVERFDVVDIAPYRPNSCLVFFKTRHSFHAVSPEAAEAPNGRFGMQVQIYEPANGALIDLSEPDLVRPNQQRQRRLPRARRLARTTMNLGSSLARRSRPAGT
jgi:hypothetical protein